MLVDCHAHFEYNNGNMMMFAHHADKMLNRLDKVDCDYVIQATNRPLDFHPSIQAHAEYDVFPKKLYEESGGKGLSYFIYDPAFLTLTLVSSIDSMTTRHFVPSKFIPRAMACGRATKAIVPVGRPPASMICRLWRTPGR